MGVCLCVCGCGGGGGDGGGTQLRAAVASWEVEGGTAMMIITMMRL